MLFFFKRKKLVLDAFTPHEIIANQYPISPSNKHTPDWWRALPADLPPDRMWPSIPTSSMKRCQGFIDNFSNSFTLPLWTDIAIELTGRPSGIEARYACADQLTQLEIHDPSQYRGFVDLLQYQHYKILAPWYIRSNKDTLWNFQQSTWNHGPWLGTMNILPGQVDFVYQNVVHINTLWKLGAQGRTSTMIPAGTPMIQLSARTEEEVDLRTHAVTIAEYNKMMYVPKFQGLYKENKAKRCPFH